MGRNAFLRCAFADTSRLCSRQSTETFLFLLLERAVENLGGGNQRTIASEFDQNKLCSCLKTLKTAPSAHTCTKGQHIGLPIREPRSRGREGAIHTLTCSSTPTATQQAMPATRGGTVAKSGRGNVGGGKLGVCLPPSPSSTLSVSTK